MEYSFIVFVVSSGERGGREEGGVGEILGWGKMKTGTLGGFFVGLGAFFLRKSRISGEK